VLLVTAGTAWEAGAPVAPRQRFAIAGKAREEVGDDCHITGIDELLSQIRRVLDNAVALMQMNDRGPFTTAAARRGHRPAVLPTKELMPLLHNLSQNL
jgi:hypothetical protein